MIFNRISIQLGGDEISNYALVVLRRGAKPADEAYPSPCRMAVCTGTGIDRGHRKIMTSIMATNIYRPSIYRNVLDFAT